jgi:hypothetical protein
MISHIFILPLAIAVWFAAMGQKALAQMTDLEQLIAETSTSPSARAKLLEALPQAPITLAMLMDRDPVDGSLMPGTILKIYLVTRDGKTDAMLFTSPKAARMTIAQRHLVISETGRSAAVFLLGDAEKGDPGFWLKGMHNEVHITHEEARKIAGR